ncbi:MAG: aminotransferase class IV [Ilumatobacteraceae bacterium]
MSPTSPPTTAAPTTGPAPTGAAFGSVFGPSMAVSRFDGATWSAPEVVDVASFGMHPGTHALHYGSSCFEGLKAHRFPDGRVVPFRPDVHIARLRQSTARLCLPVPDAALVARLIDMTVAANEAVAPQPPGSLYLRPTELGTDVTIGAAASPSVTAVLFVLACPVGDYLPPRPLTISVETVTPRTTPQFGIVKAGANYAMALPTIMVAKERDGADQVLFAPGGHLQETGASNIVLIDGEHLVTPALTEAYLHGVTRDSLLRLARHLGWTVEERGVTVADVVEWIARPTAEVALSGTAAVVAPVGTLVVDGTPLAVGGGTVVQTAALRAALVDIQTGCAPFDW